MNIEQIRKMNKSDLEPAAALYAQVFAGEPWKEVSRCNKCRQELSSSTVEEAKPCVCGGTFSLEAYPVEGTAKYIGKETSRAQALSYLSTQLELANNVEKLLGFSWGYSLNAADFAQEKYNQEEMRELIRNLLVQSGLFFYVSEVGVAQPFQGSRGRQLLSRLVDERPVTLPTVVLRTNENSPMRYLSEKFGMRPIVGLNSGLKDKENEERVIFVNR